MMKVPYSCRSGQALGHGGVTPPTGAPERRLGDTLGPR
jgi:hypothetical protein